MTDTEGERIAYHGRRTHNHTAGSMRTCPLSTTPTNDYSIHNRAISCRASEWGRGWIGMDADMDANDDNELDCVCECRGTGCGWEQQLGNSIIGNETGCRQSATAKHWQEGGLCGGRYQRRPSTHTTAKLIAEFCHKRWYKLGCFSLVFWSNARVCGPLVRPHSREIRIQIVNCKLLCYIIKYFSFGSTNTHANWVARYSKY